jgi:hypothetical protein
MTAPQYTVLFRVECLHGYFGGDTCRSLTLTPTEDCRRLLARYRMLFRSATGSCAVYCLKESPPDLLKQFDETSAFTFALTSTDPALNNYTDIDLGKLDPAETVFHFDNRTDYAKEEFGQLRQLLYQPGISLAEAALPVRAKVSTIASPAAGARDFKIIEPLGNQILRQGTFPPQGASALLDLRNVREGLYILQIDSTPPQLFYLTDQLAVRRWGVISIYPGGSRQAGQLPDNCRVLDSDGVPSPKTFTLALETRKTVWRYYIIPSAGQQNFSQYQLASTTKKTPGPDAGLESEFQFALLPATSVIDGRTAWVFESTAALPFLQTPANAFSLNLRPNKNGKAGQRTIRLPYAQPVSMVRHQGSGSGSMRSEIFVYV